MTTPPHYVPVNEYVYAAALSGCVAGAMGSQPVTSVRDETYGDTADNAIAFAEEFDTLWDGASLDVVQYEAILDSCTSYWRGRLPQSSVPSEYEGICDALITMVNEVDATAIAAGATPPAWPPAGEGGGDVAPLTRVRYVDGDASGVTGPNGAAVVGQTSGGPFPTVTAALAAFGVSTSTLDAETNVSVYVAPSEAGYTDTAVVPSYRSAAIIGLQPRTFIGYTGGLTIESNAGGGAVPGGFQLVTLQDMEVSGPVTVSADGTGPAVILILDGGSVGSLVATATEFAELLVFNAFNEVLGVCNIPHTAVSIAGSCTFAGALTCVSLQQTGGVLDCQSTVACSGIMQVFSLGPSSTFAGNVTVNGAGNTFFGCLFGAASYTNSDVTGTTKFQACTFNTTAIHEPNVTLIDCVFEGGAQITANTITTDAESWVNYLAQGGLLGSAALTIVGQTASGYTTSAAFPQAFAVTPVVSPGTPVLAFNLVPHQSGRLTLHGIALVNTDAAEIASFAVFAQVGASATGGVAAGPSALFGTDAAALTVPAITTAPIGVFQPPITVGVTGTQTMTLDCHIDGVALGANLCVWVQAISAAGGVVWSLSMNVECDERPLN